MREASHSSETIESDVISDRQEYPRTAAINYTKIALRGAKVVLAGVACWGASHEFTDTSKAIGGNPVIEAKNSQVAHSAQAEPDADADPLAEGSDGHPGLEDANCTSIRSGANYIYMGLACKEDGATYQKVDDGYAKDGWTYATILVRGIYKCGYMREGEIEEKQQNPEAVAKCREFFSPLVEKRYRFFQKYNCGPDKNGLDKCVSGTYFTHISKRCKALNLKTIYGNFATAKPTPFNALGTGQGGFSMPLPNELQNGISYRTEVKHGSTDGKAIVVRDTQDTPYLDWGLYPTICAPQNQRDGGPLKD